VYLAATVVLLTRDKAIELPEVVRNYSPYFMPGLLEAEGTLPSLNAAGACLHPAAHIH